MATTVNVTSNYAGKEAGKIIGKAFKEADTIRLGLIDIYQNVNYKLNMRLLQYVDGTKDYSCIADGGFTTVADGTVTLTEKVLEPVKLMLPLQVCKEDFRQTWSEDLEGDSAHNPNLAQDISEAIQLEVLSRTAERTDNLIWNGDSNNAGEWDGFIKLFDADGSVIKANNGLVPTGNAITKANVEAEFDKVTTAIPYALRRKDLIFAVSPDVADAYTKYLIENGAANGLGGNANTNLVYGRYNITVVNGLADNTIVIYQKENLAFGTGLLGDHNELKIVDEDEIGLLTGQVRMKMVYNGGVQYANSDEIVYYLSTTTPA